MHVKFNHTDGEWHRFMLDRQHPNYNSWRSQNIITGARTACGRTIGAYYAVREESYDGKLCEDGCFTVAELLVAKDQRIEEERQAIEDADRFDDERAERARQIAESQTRVKERQDDFKRRFDTGETEPIPKPDDPGRKR